MSRRVLAALFSTSALFAAPICALAQSAQPADLNTIQTVTVTAQRRAENLQSVPVTVNVVDANNLRSRDLNDLQQLSLAVPSLQATTDSDYTIRGVGTQAFSNTLDSSVGIAIDDVNLGKPALGGSLFNDIARVEVLDGPQGLLFGKNASAGLLNIVTNRPVLGRFLDDAELEYDYRDTAEGKNGVVVRNTLNIPVTPDSALRLNIVYNNQDDPIRYQGTGSPRVDLGNEEKALRLKYLWKPNDHFTAYLIGEYAKDSGIGGQFDRTYRSLGAGSIDVAAVAGDGVTPGKDNLSFGGETAYYHDFETGGLQGNFSYVTDSGLEITDIAAWKFYNDSSSFDGDFTSSNGASLNHDINHYSQESNELRIATPTAGRFFGQAGIFYLHSETDDNFSLGVDEYLPSFISSGYPLCVNAKVGVGGCTVSNSYVFGSDDRYDLVTDSGALFGQGTFRATDQLRLIAGGRLTYDSLKDHLVQNTGHYFVPALSGTFNPKTDNTNFSYKLGAQYDVTSQVMAYFTYSTGYKAPGFNSTAASTIAPLTVKPETVDAYELGFKSTFFAHRLLIDASLFREEFSNYQTQSFDTANQVFIVQNAATLRSQGIELTLTAKPVEGLTLNASVTSLDSRFGSFPGAQCYPGQATPTCVSSGVFNAAGYNAPQAPHFASTFQAEYEHEIGSGFYGSIQGNVYSRSSETFLVNNALGAHLGAEDIFGASAGIGPSDRSWRVSIFCKNCTDQRTPTSISLEAGDSNAGVASYIQQFDLNSFRTIGIRLNARL